MLKVYVPKNTRAIDREVYKTSNREPIPPEIYDSIAFSSPLKRTWHAHQPRASHGKKSTTPLPSSRTISFTPVLLPLIISCFIPSKPTSMVLTFLFFDGISSSVDDLNPACDAFLRFEKRARQEGDGGEKDGELGRHWTHRG